MVPFEKCFIMLSTKNTEQECLLRNLFGDRRSRLDDLREIKLGDVGFLLNTSRNELIGVFAAASQAQLNIDEGAWQGEFPAQIRVAPMGEIKHLLEGDLLLAKAGVQLAPLPSGRLVPVLPVQPREVGLRLIQAFE